MSNREIKLFGRRANRRLVLKSATGAAASFCAWGVAGKPYRRVLAQESVRAQILKIPGAGQQPTEADMQKVGELCLTTQNKGKFKGQKVTFIGLNNAGFHNNIFRPLTAAWQEATGAEIQWIDVPQAEVFAKVQQAIATGTVEFDILERGAPCEGDMRGKGLATEMPDWVKQHRHDDYVGYLQAPGRHLGRQDVSASRSTATATTSTTAPTCSAIPGSPRSGSRVAAGRVGRAQDLAAGPGE
ncbi:MAG: hypothetical protein KatS3mg059_0849 [Thermomicrobiales bacterium]|nr:MAG: hypothetical protein KatS3mg059_0849 [Thermomicrobiales bacterium]